MKKKSTNIPGFEPRTFGSIKPYLMQTIQHANTYPARKIDKHRKCETASRCSLQRVNKADSDHHTIEMMKKKLAQMWLKM